MEIERMLILAALRPQNLSDGSAADQLQLGPVFLR